MGHIRFDDYRRRVRLKIQEAVDVIERPELEILGDKRHSELLLLNMIRSKLKRGQKSERSEKTKPKEIKREEELLAEESDDLSSLDEVKLDDRMEEESADSEEVD